MKRAPLFILVFICSAFAASAQQYFPVNDCATNWVWLNPLPNGAPHAHIFYTKQGIVVYDGNGIYGIYSHNDGHTWEQFMAVDTSSEVPINGNIQFVNDSVGFSLANNNFIYKS